MTCTFMDQINLNWQGDIIAKRIQPCLFRSRENKAWIFSGNHGIEALRDLHGFSVPE